MTTYASFISTISGVSITGVMTVLDYRPLGKHTPDLPCSFPELPGGVRNYQTSTSCMGDQKDRTCDLIVLLEPIGQGTQKSNYDAVVAMMDYVETALDTLYTGGQYVFTYEIAAGIEQRGEVQHWQVIASLSRFTPTGVGNTLS